MKKVIGIILCIILIFNVLFIKWFNNKKYQIEHIKNYGFTDGYTYTKQEQIEEVLFYNREIIENLVLKMNQYEGDRLGYLMDGLDDDIKRGDRFAIDNKSELLKFFEQSKMTIIMYDKTERTCQIRQTEPFGESIHLELIGVIDENDNFEWKIYIRDQEEKYLSVNLYNFIYNRKTIHIKQPKIYRSFLLGGEYVLSY